MRNVSYFNDDEVIDKKYVSYDIKFYNSSQFGHLRLLLLTMIYPHILWKYNPTKCGVYIDNLRIFLTIY